MNKQLACSRRLITNPITMQPQTMYNQLKISWQALDNGLAPTSQTIQNNLQSLHTHSNINAQRIDNVWTTSWQTRDDELATNRKWIANHLINGKQGKTKESIIIVNQSAFSEQIIQGIDNELRNNNKSIDVQVANDRRRIHKKSTTNQKNAPTIDKHYTNTWRNTHINNQQAFHNNLAKNGQLLGNRSTKQKPVMHNQSNTFDKAWQLIGNHTRPIRNPVHKKLTTNRKLNINQ